MENNSDQLSKEFQNQFADEPVESQPRKQESEAFHDSKPAKQNPIYLYGLIAMLCLIAVGLFALRRMTPIAPKKTDQTTLSPTEVPVNPTAQPQTTNETASWREMKQSGWTFKVPTNWKYLKCSEDLLFVGPPDDSWMQKDQIIECNFDATPGWVMISRTNNLKIPTAQDGVEVVSKVNIKVDGKDVVVQQEVVREGQGAGASVRAYIPSENTILILHQDTPEKKALFDQILSTFKFTGSESTSSVPSGFTSYKNTALQYSLTLPSTWRAYDQVSGSAAKPTSEIVEIMDINKPASTPYPSGVIEITTYSSMVNAYASWQHSTKTINDIVVQVYENENEAASVYLFPQPNRDSFIQLKFNGSKESSYYPGFVQIASSFKFTGPLNP